MPHNWDIIAGYQQTSVLALATDDMVPAWTL
jgi:hypothetical protein